MILRARPLVLSRESIFFSKLLPRPKKGERFEDVFLFFGNRDDLVARLSLAEDKKHLQGSLFFSERGGLGFKDLDQAISKDAVFKAPELIEVFNVEAYDFGLRLSEQNVNKFGPIFHLHTMKNKQHVVVRCLVCASRNENCWRIVDEKTNRELKNSGGELVYKVFEVIESDEKNPRFSRSEK